MLLLKDVSNQAVRLSQETAFAVASDDSCGVLTAVLQNG
tara:strand:+ start:57 stop:173 length:117 start_codon:yes stop_codon:yes gene_type:complete